MAIMAQLLLLSLPIAGRKSTNLRDLPGARNRLYIDPVPGAIARHRFLFSAAGALKVVKETAAVLRRLVTSLKAQQR